MFVGAFHCARAAGTLTLLAFALATGPMSPAGAATASPCEKLDGQPGIDACTRDIKSGKLKGRALVTAYHNRAIDYIHIEQHDLAIADYNEAIRIEPTNAFLYRARGSAYLGKKDYAHAMQDYNEVIRMNPSDKVGYDRRAGVYMQTLDVTAAAGEYARIMQIDPKDEVAKYIHAVLTFYGGATKDSIAAFDAMDPKESIYMPLWSEIIRRRNRMPSRLASMASSINSKEWPGPVIGMFQKTVKPEDALAQARAETDADGRKIKICDVIFYGGELDLLNGATAKANAAFAKAVEECKPGTVEWVAASSELKKGK